MSDKLHVNKASGLLMFLTSQLKGWARSKIKQRLQSGCVMVNGEAITKHDFTLKPGDVIDVLGQAKNAQNLTGNLKLEILFSDSDIIAINKPAGLLSVTAAKENKNHALAILRHQLSRPKHPIQLWPVHRLDRDTSGVLLFATSRKTREKIMSEWSKTEKIYLAVVKGCPNPSQGTVNQPLRMDHNEYRMHVGPHPEAKKAVTHFKTERAMKDRALLKVRLETGRQHQIRAHMSWLGHAIIGDPRYGTNGPRMGLHALSLTITHPKTGKRLTFETPAPNDFFALLG